MARAHLYMPITTSNGDIIAPIIIRLLEPNSTTSISETVFAGATGTAEHDNTGFLNNDGVVDVYLAEPRRVRLGITPPGQNEMFIDDIDIGTDAVLYAPAPLQILNTPTQVGEVLQTTADGEAEWGPPTNAYTRGTAQYTTAVMGAGATSQGTINLAKSYRVMAIQTSAPARVRLYTRAAARAADVNRSADTDPADGAGVVLDYVTTAELGTASRAELAPQAIGSSMENTPGVAIPISVTPTGAGAVTVTITYTPLES